MFLEAGPRETLRFERNKINCFPPDQPLSDLLYIAHEEKLFPVQFMKINCSDVIHFAILPAQRFWRYTVSLLDVM